jgi:LmbE family N-acetylglucosaminyl deacetylase
MNEQLVVVTPHLGDAVQGCGELIASHPGAVVVTVFAEIPADAYVVSEWDAACGFSSPRQAVTVHRREDREAMDRLDAEPCWLACRDSQYRRLRNTSSQEIEDEISVKLTRALRRHGSRRIAVPLGVLAGDHTLAHRAALRLVRRRRDLEWIAYADGTAPADTIVQRIVALERLGFAFSAVETATRMDAVWRKERAARCYESLLRGYAAAGRSTRVVAGAERYWRLSK